MNVELSKISTSFETQKTTATKVFFIALVVFVFGAANFVQGNTLSLEGRTPISIKKGKSVTRNIKNVGGIGRFNFRMNWYTNTLIPNRISRLKIQLKHGNRILHTKNCYPLSASGKSPRCVYAFDVSGTESKRSGKWKLTITNNSNYDVKGFDIRKGNDRNPLLSNFYSTFKVKVSCRAKYWIDLEERTLSLNKGRTITRRIYLKPTDIIKEGRLRLRAKWHVASVIPTFNKLKIQLIKPNGQVARTGSYYSYQARGKYPRLDFTYNVSRADANLRGNWQLKITNNSRFNINGFDLEKGRDLNPLVPSFKSEYIPKCSPHY